MPFPAGYLSRSPRTRDAAAASAPLAPATSRADAARRDLLDRIADFVTRHDLAMTASNLATICGALSGSHPELAGAMMRREAAGEPIDQAWLDSLAQLDVDTHANVAAFETLSDTLEYAIARFAQTARTAQTETSDHRGAIDAQIATLAGPDGLAQVLDLSRAMLVRIEQIEAAMARSEAEMERLRESLAHARSEADVDHLTRLPNRRAFERKLAAAAIEARETGAPLSLAFCDVDHFKQINDRHGHAAGDRVLCALAGSFAEAAGEHCFVARHGGEEFVLLFRGLRKEAARGRLDAIRRAQAARQLMNRETGQPFGKITFSAGVAEVTEDPDTRSALARADAALYRAKQLGRNRVELG
ncbi:GGDEF domain-containing protein [Erythrobacter sp. BLCC-B19]|uniref:GGDEF domain-containing protein n=1 Tax=Erythrobacter sp. BLCC-B19 TaxID=3025315 RepID=UPI0023629CBF|nr:GGDEF domain-containing protein [Erythrobacter sp. BLCC-B19]WDA41998.1 GGDEF domain-containing protein [Erythrobacter sp. BLCC-B19]